MLEKQTIKRIEWRLKSIRDRCNNPKKKDYKLYGARGIKCEFGYADFKEWILKGFENLGIDVTKDQSVLKALDTYSVDRIDSSGNYSVLNCTLTERRENEYLQLVEVNHIRLDRKTYIPIWLFDLLLKKPKQWFAKRTKRLKYASEFSFLQKEMLFNLVWFDFQKPPLFVKDGKVQCPKCKTHFTPQRVLKCECGFHTKEAKMIKKPQSREEVRRAERRLYEIERKGKENKMNDFLNAEQRIRLKCVFLHSTKYAIGEKELSLEEVAFVLGASKERVRQVECTAIEKLKRRGWKFIQFFKELDQ